MSDYELTVGDLRRHLAGFDDDTVIDFAGGLTFYRVKRWGDDRAFIEFNEAQADLTPAFKQRNPQVKVAFIDTDNGGVINATLR